MEFIKMTRKGNLKVRDEGAVVKLYAKPQHGCAGCALTDNDGPNSDDEACRRAVCGPLSREAAGWGHVSVIFVRERA